MSGHDIYVISPYLGVAGVAILVILLDLVIQRKAMLPVLAFLGLLVPLAFSLVQAFDLDNQLNLVRGAEPLFSGADSVLLGSLSVDRFALFFNFLVLAATGLVILSSTDYTRQMERFRGEYYGLILFSATGMMLLAAATELITIYISLELTTMPLVALAAFMMTSRSSEAGMKFLIIGAISSAIMLYGMALIFGFTGSTNLSEIAASVAATSGDLPFGNIVLLVGVVLMVVGFGFKISSAPFQMWVPDVYEGAPTPIVAFLSVASKAAAFAVLLRVLYVGFFDVSLDWAALMAALATVSMIVGNLVAISQSNIRRLFGYSTIAHAGYILVGVAAGVKASGADSNLPEFVSVGPDSVLFYLGAYAAANLTAFFAIIAIGNRIGSDLIDDYAGGGPSVTFAGSGPGPGLSGIDRCTPDQHLYRQALHLHGGGEGRPDLVGHPGGNQQCGIRLLLYSHYPGNVSGTGPIGGEDFSTTRFLVGSGPGRGHHAVDRNRAWVYAGSV